MSQLTLICAEIIEILKKEPAPGEHPFSGKRLDTCVLPKSIPLLADFEGATFISRVDFSGVRFERGASFVDTTFEDQADFTEATFSGPAYFWRCHFKGEAIFLRARIEPIRDPEGRRYSGEANFSYTIFDRDADFKRVQFGGPSFFHRSCFQRTVDFEEATFNGFVKFEGQEADVCIPAKLLPEEDLRLRLKESAVIKYNADHPPKTDGSGFYNMNSSLKTDADLRWALNLEEDTYVLRSTFLNISRPPKEIRKKLPDFTRKKWIVFTEEEYERVRELKNANAFPTFSRKHPAKFIRTNFLCGATFSEVSLKKSLFQETSLDKVTFVAVKWNMLPLTFGLGTRSGLYDEDKEVRNEKGLLENTYHDIRMTYQRRGATDLARDFYYGEMELRFNAQPSLKRVFSLAFLYRYLSGYGRQQGLAGAWLICMIFFIFPLLWLVVGFSSPVNLSYLGRIFSYFTISSHPKTTIWITRILVSELNSLEACTFIARDITKYPAEQRLVAGIERLVVAAQLGLFVLATKWKFERSSGGS